MRFRTLLILVLALCLAAGALAQNAPAAPPDAPATTTAPATATAPAPEATAVDAAERAARAVEPPTSQEIKNEFDNVLRRYPQELGTILALDPTLLSNEAFLTGYPDLLAFTAAHPEVRRNPGFFLAGYQLHERSTTFEDILKGLFVLTIFIFIAFVVSWFVRTVIEQRRWSRLSRMQGEVHNKILDRFGSSEELLAYIRTPAGTKFLESAPIPLRLDQANHTAPAARILWSIQFGVVIAVAALGVLLVSLRFSAQTAQGLFAMGAIAFSVGAGFIVSAVVSLAVSRRLGLWQRNGESAASGFDDPALVK